MAQDTSGIMGLQEDYFSKGMLPPEMGLEVADGAMKNLAPQVMPEMDKFTSELSGQLAKLSDEELDIFIQLVQQLYDEPENYAENRAHLIQGGDIAEEDVPTDYQPEALATMLYVLRKEKQARSGGKDMAAQPSSMPPMAGAAPAEMQPPQGFARGGIAEAARIVAGGGRNGDTMLAHITPREAKLLRKHGGSGTINPATGLPEYGLFSFLKDLWNVVWHPVKKLLNTTVGKIVSRVALNVLLPGYGEIIYAGLQGAAQDKSFGDIVKNMAIAGVTQYLGGQIPGVESPIKGFTDSLAQGIGIGSEVGKQALLQGVVNTGAGLLQGQNLKDAATNGLMAAGTTVASSYLKDTFKPQGEYNAETGKVEGNRVIGNDTNVMQDKMGLGRAPVEDMSTGINNTLSADELAAKYNDPLLQAQPDAVTRSTIAPPVNAATTTGQSPVNAGTSTNVQTGATPGSSTSAPYKPVSVGDAFSTMGQGAKQIMGGEFSKGVDTFGTGAKDLFMPSSPDANQLAMRQGELMKNNPSLTPTQAMDLAKGEAPGMLRTYGPAAAAGLGIMAMAGGFSPQGPQGNPNGPQFRGPTGEDLLKADPKKYLVQGMPGVQYDASGNIIGNKEQYPYYGMNDIRVASNYGTQARYADGGPVMSDDSEMNQYAGGGVAYLAAGGMPRMMGMSRMTPEMEDKLRSYYMHVPIGAPGFQGKKIDTGVLNVNQSGIMANSMLAKAIQAQRDAQAAAAAQAATAAANAPGQANKLYAANPEQYRPNMQQPQYMATGGPANGAGHAGFGMDPNDPQMVEYRNMAQSLTPAARQYMAAHNNNGAIADMNMMREAMAYSAKEAARRAPAQENQLYAANPQQYQPNMTRPSGIAGLAMGGYPRKTGQISGPGTETSDSVPAMLSDGEFVMTARAVRGLGKGDRREGAKKMYALMHQLERNAARG